MVRSKEFEVALIALAGTILSPGCEPAYTTRLMPTPEPVTPPKHTFTPISPDLIPTLFPTPPPLLNEKALPSLTPPITMPLPGAEKNTEILPQTGDFVAQLESGPKDRTSVLITKTGNLTDLPKELFDQYTRPQDMFKTEDGKVFRWRLSEPEGTSQIQRNVYFEIIHPDKSSPFSVADSGKLIGFSPGTIAIMPEPLFGTTDALYGAAVTGNDILIFEATRPHHQFKIPIWPEYGKIRSLSWTTKETELGTIYNLIIVFKTPTSLTSIGKLNPAIVSQGQLENYSRTHCMGALNPLTECMKQLLDRTPRTIEIIHHNLPPELINAQSVY